MATVLLLLLLLLLLLFSECLSSLYLATVERSMPATKAN